MVQGRNQGRLDWEKYGREEGASERGQPLQSDCCPYCSHCVGAVKEALGGTGSALLKTCCRVAAGFKRS